MAATQRDTLGMFTALCLARSSWAGALLVGVGLNDAGRTLALAGLAAGAACILLEENAEQLRAAQREGCCTFSVTSLDEALRIVKNEVRQRRAIAVALSGNPATWLQDMADRGVQPQAFASTRALPEIEAAPIDVLCARGMQTLSGLGLSTVQGDSVPLADTLEQSTAGRWTVQEEQASSLGERRAMDARWLEGTTGDDAFSAIARRWLQAAPALFPRALDRCYWRAV